MINIVQILPIGFRVDEDGKELATEHTFKNALSFVLGYLLQHQSESQTFTLTITKILPLFGMKSAQMLMH